MSFESESKLAYSYTSNPVNDYVREHHGSEIRRMMNNHPQGKISDLACIQYVDRFMSKDDRQKLGAYLAKQ
jgi:hypothetical protein